MPRKKIVSHRAQIEKRNLLRGGKPAALLAVLIVATAAFGLVVSRSRSGFEHNRATAHPPAPPSTNYNANTPAREYFHAGGKLVATSEPANFPVDLAIWRLSTGEWWVIDENGAMTTETFGDPDDLPAPGDYDGDAKTDFCVFRPMDGNWYLLQSGSGNTMAVYTFGASGDKPVPGDYNGDGKTELALYRQSDHTWHLQDTTQGYLGSWQYGAPEDVPVPSDYDGDGKADLAMWRGSNATWYVWRSSDSAWTEQAWGATGDKPLPGDYDGDGKTDYSVWQSSNVWHIRRSSTGTAAPPVAWGYQSTDISVQGDYDSDGKTDIAVWRPSNGTWYIIRSSNGSHRIQPWGMDGDIPVPAPYRR